MINYESFDSDNFIYENSKRGFEERKEWFDNLNEKWKNNLGINNIKYYNELLDILSNKIELSLKGIENLEPISYLNKLIVLKLNDLHGFDEYGNSYHALTYCNPINLTPIIYLSNLEELELSGFTLEDIAPLNYLKRLKKLSITMLTKRDIGGNAPFTDFNFLQEKSNLVSLKIINCGLTSIPEIFNFENIKELNLAVNNLRKISTLSRFKNIITLNLSNNKSIESFQIINNISKITSLNLSFTRFQYLKEISNLTSLMSLNVSNTLIINIEHICLFEKLETLDLSKNKISDLTPLQNLKFLKILYLKDIKICEIKPIINLIDLSELILDESIILDIESLYKMKQLKILSLLNCKLSEENKNNLKSTLPDCNIIFENIYLPY